VLKATVMKSILGKSILVIDDDAAMLRALGKVLSSEGAVVATASWVGELMERLAEKQGSVDLIITDIRMPVMDGRSILRAVKAALPEVPVIVITAFATPEARAECEAAGAADFLEKPLDTPQLLAAIERALSQGTAHRGGEGRRFWGLRRKKAPSQGNETDVFPGSELAGKVGSQP
jgi:DNA-binding NtrC family response regulator